jgi:uncharacterized protein (TIGR01244 family)
MKKLRLSFIVASALASSWIWAAGPEAPANREANFAWVAPGIPNFHQVGEQIYRGGQPRDDGWQSLSKLGVRVVIDLRRDGEDGDHSLNQEAEIVKAAGMRYVSVPMKAVVAPAGDDIRRILALLNSGDTVFVHCRKGMDRTGTVIAAYRITHDRWPNGQALKEAESLGMGWTELGMKRYIRKLQPSDQREGASPRQQLAPPPGGSLP